MEIQATIIDSIGKLSIEVVAILTLSYIVYTQGKGHKEMSRSIDRLTIALTKKLDRDHHNSKSLKKSIDKIDVTLDNHRKWAKSTVAALRKART